MRQQLQKKTLPQQYLTARLNLLLMVALSFVNLILIVVNADVQFMFSASLPTFAAIWGYGLDTAAGTQIFFTLGILISAVWIGVFLLCFFLSKKKGGFMITAVILFAVDCIFCIANFFLYLEAIRDMPEGGQATLVSCVIEVLFHAWIISSLIMGWRTGKKLKARYGTLTPDPAQVQQESGSYAPNAQTPSQPYYGSYDPNAQPDGGQNAQAPAQPYGGQNAQAPAQPYGGQNAQAPAQPYGGQNAQAPAQPYGGQNAQAPAQPYGGQNAQAPAQPYGVQNAQTPAQPYGGQNAQAPAQPYGGQNAQTPASSEDPDDPLKQG